MATKHSKDYAHQTPRKQSGDELARAGRIGSSPGEALKAAGPLLHVGIQVGLTMAMMAGLGYFVDDWLGTSPWGILLGGLLGIIAVFVVLLRLVADLNKVSAQRYGRPTTGAATGKKTESESGD